MGFYEDFLNRVDKLQGFTENQFVLIKSLVDEAHSIGFDDGRHNKKIIEGSLNTGDKNNE